MSSGTPGAPRGIERLPERLSLAAGYLLLAVCLVTTWSVFMRYVVRQPIAWTYDTSGYALLFIAAAGVSYALVLRRHINVDLLVNKFKGKTRQGFDLFSLIVSLFWAVIVAWGTWNRTMFTLRTGKVGTNLTFLPIWTVDIIVPIGMALFVIIGLLQLQKEVRHFGKSAPEGQKPKGGHS